MENKLIGKTAEQLADECADQVKKWYPNGSEQIIDEFDQVAQLLGINRDDAAGALFYAKSKVGFGCDKDELICSLQMMELTKEQATMLADYVMK